MGLLGDVQEVSDVWRRAPWRVKVFYAISLFLAVSSLASLAEYVAAWKGLFLTGVQFYQEWIRDPFFGWVSKLTPLEYHGQKSDSVTITALFTIALLRSRFLQTRPVTTSIDVTTNKMITIGIVCYFGFIALTVGSIPYDNTPSNLPFIAYPISLVVYLNILALSFIQKEKGARALLIKVYLLAPPAVVCILAAINLGLRST